MLGKHVLTLIPSNIIPALAAFGAVYCYTRLLSPDDFGHYALAINTMTLISAVFFTWLNTALPRLMPQAMREGTADQLRVTTYVAFGGMCGVVLLFASLFLGFVPLGELYGVVLLAVPLALVRSFLNMNQAFHRSALNFKKYNLIECGQAVLGFIIGLALVWFLHLGYLGATLGLIVGLLAMTLVDARQMLNASWGHFSKTALMAIVRFGLPLTFTFGFAFIIASSDRYFIEHFHGAAQVGIYAAGYTLVDRICTIVFMAVALPAFPLTIHRLEHEGHEAAREQTYSNGVALLVLAMPACAGLMLTSQELAAVFIGEAFREGARQVMPWIASSAILNGMATHYFDHAFHLAKKPYLLFLTQGPTAVLNLALNIILIPKYGYMGAAYATAASYVVLLVLSVIVGRQAFVMKFPWRPALQITAAVIVMALVLSVVPFPDTIFGLATKIAVGGIVYAIVLFGFNTANMRGKVYKVLGRS